MKNLKGILAFAAGVEVATGIALLIGPSTVCEWVLGSSLSAGSWPVGRWVGIALLALGLACWPARTASEAGRNALRGMLLYNAAVAIYLGALGALGAARGVLLWPAVLLHAVVALLLAWSGSRRPS